MKEAQNDIKITVTVNTGETMEKMDDHKETSQRDTGQGGRLFRGICYVMKLHLLLLNKSDLVIKIGISIGHAIFHLELNAPLRCRFQVRGCWLWSSVCLPRAISP